MLFGPSLLVLATSLPTTAGTPHPPFPSHQAEDPEAAYRFLTGLVERQLYPQAIREARAFLGEHPRHARAPLARYQLGHALFATGDWKAACAEYDRLGEARGFEFRIEALYRGAECRLSLGDPGAAATRLREVLSSDTDYLHPGAALLLGECHYASSEFGRAAQTFQSLLERWPAAPEVEGARHGLTWAAFELGEFTAALERGEDYLRHHADEERAAGLRLLLGEVLLELERPDEARRFFRTVEAPELAPGRARGLAHCDALEGRHGPAAERFLQLAREHPGTPEGTEAVLQGGVELLLAGQADAAAEWLAREGNSRDPETLSWRARAEAEAGRGEPALELLETALAQGPTPELGARLERQRGEVLLTLGRSAEAARAFERGGSAESLVAAAIAALEADRPEDALRLTDRHLREAPGSDTEAAARTAREKLFRLERFEAAGLEFASVGDSEGATEGQRCHALSRGAWCEYRRGNLAGAQGLFLSLLERSPSAPESEEALALATRIAQEAGESQAALVNGRRYLERYPEGNYRAEVLYTLARASEGPAARPFLEELVERHPEDERTPEALLVLADLQRASGDGEAAEASYARLVKEHGNSTRAAEAAYGLAWADFEAGRFGDCAERTARLLEQTELTAELREGALELRLWALARSGDLPRARAAWKDLRDGLDDDGRRVEAGRAMAEALRAAGETEGTVVLWRDLIGRLQDPAALAEARIEVVFAALDRGDPEGARAELLPLFGEAPPRPAVAEAAFFVADALFTSQRDTEALPLFLEVARGAGPHAPEALHKAGFAELRREDPGAAEVHLVRLLDTFPKDERRPETLALLGEARFRVERYADVLAPLEEVRTRFPRHAVMPTVLLRLGVSLAHLERWKDAESCLARLEKRHPDHPHRAEAELWRGRALVHLGKERAARAAFGRVVALSAGDLSAQARLGLGDLEEAAGRHEEALSHFLKVVVLHEGTASVPEALWRAALTLEALELPGQARERLEELQRDHPNSSWAERARTRDPGGDRR